METDKPDLDKRLCQQIFPGSIGSFADTGNQKQDKDPAAHDKNDRDAAQKSKYIKALLPAFAET